MGTTTTSENQKSESTALRLRQGVNALVFAAAQLAPRIRRLRQNPTSWFAIRVMMGLAGAALVVLPLSFGYFLILPILGMALFLAATLLPPAPHDVTDEEIAQELGALWVLEGGDHQAGSVLGFPAKIFVGSDEVWVLVDKSEGVVKTQNSPAVFCHRFACQSGWRTEALNRRRAQTDRSANHRYGLNHDHDSSIRIPVQHRDESAQSILRSSLR